MQPWTDAVSNPQALAALPADTGVHPVELHELILHRDATTLRLRFDLAVMPAPRPARWDAQANTCQLRLACFGVSDYLQRGFQPNMRGGLQVAPAGQGWSVVFNADGVEISFVTTLLRVESLSGYIDGED